MLIFLYARWDKILSLKSFRISYKQSFIFLCLATLFFFFPLNKLLSYLNENYAFLSVARFTLFYFIFFFIFIAVFGIRIFNYFFKEFFLISLIYILFVAMDIAIHSFWQYFSRVIILSLQSVMPFFVENISFDIGKFK